MLRASSLVVIAALSACGEERSTDCEAALKEVLACMNRMEQAGQLSSADFFDKCVPMTEPQRFHGTWATDFEFNEFYSGKVLAAKDVWQIPEPTTRLWGDALESYSNSDMAYVVEVEFVGRRPICNFEEPVRDIVVDDLIRARVIERGPSKF